MSEGEQESWRSLPLEDRLVNSVWKSRYEAYDELNKLMDRSSSEADPCFNLINDNYNLLKQMVSDANIVAQEAGILCLVKYLELGPEHKCLASRQVTLKPLVEKGVGSTRAGVKKATTSALCSYIDLDIADSVLVELVPLMTHRMPKMIIGCLATITELVSLYGTKIISPKPIVDQLSKVFAHNDKKVRDEATMLSVELYRWLGEAFSSILLPNLKPIQEKDLRQLFEKAKEEPSPQQKRFLRSQQQREARSTQDAGEIDTEMADAQEEEEIDLTDPVDVSKFIPDNVETQLTSGTWKQKKETLEGIVPHLNVPKIIPGDFGPFVNALGKCLRDVNIFVVTLAATGIQHLAMGLRQDFNRYQMIVMTPLLERTKEKKQSVLDALNGALDAIFKYSKLSDILDPILAAVDHKTPQVKIGSSSYLLRCLQATKLTPKPQEVKQIAELAVKLTGDSQATVRTAGFELLGVLIKITGPRAMNPFVDQLDDLKKEKVNSFAETVEIIPKKGGTITPPSSASTASTATTATTATPSRPAPGRIPVPSTSSTPGRNAAMSSRTPKQIPARTPIRNTNGGMGLKRRMISPVKSRTPGGPSSLGGAVALPRDSQPSLSAGSTLSKPLKQTSSTNGGLANRALGRGMSSTLSSQPRSVDSRVLAELEQLQAEKEAWMVEKQQLLARSQEEETEKNALQRIINDLEIKNADLREEHTQDMLTLKSRATQIVRLQSDLETAKSRIFRLEGEYEKMKKNSGESLPSAESNYADNTVQGLRRLTLSRDSTARQEVISPKSPSSARREHGRPLSMFSGMPPIESNSRAATVDSGGSASPDDMTSDQVPSSASSLPTMASGRPPVTENWKRAVNITADLRSRIESMKRQGQ